MKRGKTFPFDVEKRVAVSFSSKLPGIQYVYITRVCKENYEFDLAVANTILFK